MILDNYDKLINLKKFRFREIQFKDLPDVIYINRVTLPENYSRYTFIGLYKHFKDISFVAIDKDKDKVIGYILNKFDEGESFFRHDKKVVKKGHVFSIAVLPEYRRKGIASILLTLGFYSMFKKGAEEIYLEVRKSNIPAINLYKKFFMKIVGVVKSYYVDGEDANIMAVDKETIYPYVIKLAKKLKTILELV